MSDHVSANGALPTVPVRPYDIRVMRPVTRWDRSGVHPMDGWHHLSSSITIFMLMLLISRGVWPLIVLGLGGLALASRGEVDPDILTLKSWLERSLCAAALLLFIGFAAALGIGVADESLPSDYKAVLIAIAFCFASLSMTVLVWWISLSPTNPLRMREVQRKSAYIGDAIEPRRLDEMMGRGIPLLVATALLAIPPLAALILIAVNWQYASKQAFIYPAGFLTLCVAIILLCVAGVGAWREVEKKIVGRDSLGVGAIREPMLDIRSLKRKCFQFGSVSWTPSEVILSLRRPQIARNALTLSP